MSAIANKWAYKLGKICRRWLMTKGLVVEEVKPVPVGNWVSVRLSDAEWFVLQEKGELDVQLILDHTIRDGKEAKSLKEWNDALKTLTEKGNQ